MVQRCDVYIIMKDEGTLLSKFSLLGSMETPKDVLLTGFLTALNSFARELDFPAGVSLLRSGSIEARFTSGEYIFSVLIIDYTRPLNAMTEPIVTGLAQEIVEKFEEKYHDLLKGGKTKRTDLFDDFHNTIADIIEKYADETFELYQKLLLIEALYAKVPQKWILPLFERVSDGENILDDLPSIPKIYHNQLKKAIDKVNSSSSPIWDLFAIPTISSRDIDEMTA